MTARQTATVARIGKVDPTATTEEIGDVVLISYTPNWEKGRMVSGTFRENPYPRITHAVTVDGKLWGWGYGIKTKLSPEVEAKVTTLESMKPVLKERDVLRHPPKVEKEPEADVETETVKAEVKTTPKRQHSNRTRKTTAKAA